MLLLGRYHIIRWKSRRKKLQEQIDLNPVLFEETLFFDADGIQIVNSANPEGLGVNLIHRRRYPRRYWF